MAECFLDSDCPGVQLCYQNTSASWLEGGINRCFCNTEYGWAGGPDCKEFGAATYYVAGSTGLFTSIALLQALFTLLVIIAVARNNKFKFNGLTLTLVLVLLETISVAAKGIVVLTILHTPERQTRKLTLQGMEVEKAHDLLVFLRIVISLNVVFGFLAALHVSLVWLQIVSKSTSLTVQTKGVFATYHKFVFGIEGTIILLLILFASNGNFGVLGIAILPFLLITIVLYTYGLVKLKTLLTPDHGSALQYADTYKYIQQCYAGVVLSTFVIVFGVVGIGIVSVQGYKEVTPAGTVSGYVVLNEMAPWGLCTMMASILIYVFRFVKKDIGTTRKFSKNRTISSTSRGRFAITNVMFFGEQDKMSESQSV